MKEIRTFQFILALLLLGITLFLLFTGTIKNPLSRWVLLLLSIYNTITLGRSYVRSYKKKQE